MRVPPRRSAALLVALVSSCSSFGAKTIELGDVELFVGEPPDVVDQKYTLFTGGPTESFDLTLGLEGASPECPLVAKLGSGSHVATITEDGLHTLTFRGNVGILHFRGGGGLVSPPTCEAKSVTLELADTLQVPELEPELADHVRSFPLQLGEPVELPLAEDGSTYYFTVSKIAGLDLEVLFDVGEADGTSSVYMRTDSTLGFPLTAESSDFVLANHDRGYKEVSIPEHRDVMFLTVKADPEERWRLGRLCVKRRTSSQGMHPLTVRFWTEDPVPQEYVDSFAAVMQDAAFQIYMASAGRLRIPSIRVFRSRDQAGIKPVDDIYVTLPPSATPGATPGGTLPLPAGAFAVTMAHPPETALSSIGLRIFILAYRFGLKIEPFESGSQDPCPNSNMSSGIRSMCWSGNHDPHDTPDMDELSSWELLEQNTGLGAPSRKPPHVVHVPSSVFLPLKVF